MKLKPGDRIWVTPTDGLGTEEGFSWSVSKPFWVEWTGRGFVGCDTPPPPQEASTEDGSRWFWTLLDLEKSVVGANVNFMFEQLLCEGAFEEVS